MDFSVEGMQSEFIVKAMCKELAVIFFDTNKKVIQANSKMANILGYSEREIVGVQHRQFCFDDYANSSDYRQMWDSLLGSKRSYQDKIIRKKKNGEKLILEGVYFPITNEMGRVSSVMKIVFDITRREEVLQTAISNVQKGSDYLNKISIEGNEEVSVMSIHLQDVDSLAAGNQQAIEKLQEDLQKITTISIAINGIAMKTNILSFNASLEAARAGNSGNGFSIVAGEMQKVAENIKELTKEIEENLLSIQMQTQTVMSSSEATNDKIGDSQQTLNHLLSMYRDIVTTANELQAGAENLLKENQ